MCRDFVDRKLEKRGFPVLQSTWWSLQQLSKTVSYSRNAQNIFKRRTIKKKFFNAQMKKNKDLVFNINKYRENPFSIQNFVS